MSDLTCAEFVELVTDYLEGALDRETEARFVLHATQCEGCETYQNEAPKRCHSLLLLEIL